MPGRRALVLLLALAVAGTAAATALAARNYQGAARSIALTAAQAKYKALTGSTAAPKPSADKRRGYRSGWQVGYVKGTAAAPVQAYTLIYVYRTPADAKRAFVKSCKACTSKVTLEGISMKFELTNQKGTPGVIDIATCRNVYLAIVVTGKLEANALAQAAGALAGGIYSKAHSGGMTSCGG